MKEAENDAPLTEARAVLGLEAEAWDLLSCRVAARCRVAIVEGAEAKATWGGARYGNVSMASARLCTDMPYADEKAKRAEWAELVDRLRAVAEGLSLQAGVSA